MNSVAQKYLETNRNINRGFRKLEVWQEAVSLYRFVKLKLKELKTISFKVNAQVEDSIFSVSSNIAEGYCRRSIKENIQFVNIALASLGENYSQIFTLLNSEIIDEVWFREYDSLHYSLENKLIKLNQSYIEKTKKNETWNSDYNIRELQTHYSSD
ncbi:MAG: four helix bundle protein [Ignavibacteria bacterium]|nr:four helix bundle protein [Ignavibacteria bacterium]